MHMESDGPKTAELQEEEEKEREEEGGLDTSKRGIHFQDGEHFYMKGLEVRIKNADTETTMEDILVHQYFNGNEFGKLPTDTETTMEYLEVQQ